MMHACSENPQASLAAESVVAGQTKDRVFANERADDQFRKQFPELVNIPDSLAEESVVVGKVTVVNRIAGDDQIREITMSRRGDPPGHQQTKRFKARRG